MGHQPPPGVLPYLQGSNQPYKKNGRHWCHRNVKDLRLRRSILSRGQCYCFTFRLCTVYTNEYHLNCNQLSHRWPVAPGQLTFCGSLHSIQTCPSGRDTQNNMMQGIAVLLSLRCSFRCWIWCKYVFLLHTQYLSVKAQPGRCSQLQMEKRNRKKNSLGDCIVPF